MACRIFIAFLTLSLFGVAACDSGDSFSDVAATFEGVYEIATHTKNEAGCDSDGESIQSENSQTHFVIYVSKVFFITIAQAIGCDSVADCQAAAADTDVFAGSFAYTFTSSDADGEMSGTERSTGFTSSTGMCTEPRISYTELTTPSEGNIQIVQSTHIGDDYPEDSDGYCTTDAGYEAAVDKPCSQRTVLTGHFVSGL